MLWKHTKYFKFTQTWTVVKRDTVSELLPEVKISRLDQVFWLLPFFFSPRTRPACPPSCCWRSRRWTERLKKKPECQWSTSCRYKICQINMHVWRDTHKKIFHGPTFCYRLLQELVSDNLIGHTQPVFQFLCPLDKLLNEDEHYGGVWGLLSGLAYFLTPGQEEEEVKFTYLFFFMLTS